MSIEAAFQNSIETLMHWVNTHKTRVFFPSYAPVHFSAGDWKAGGSCHLSTLPDLSIIPSTSKTWPELELVNSVLSKYANLSKNGNKVQFLNLAYMSAQRRDGHTSVYYVGPKPAPRFRQDCSHWCVPGVPDTWNELLYASFLSLEFTKMNNSSKKNLLKLRL